MNSNILRGASALGLALLAATGTVLMAHGQNTKKAPPAPTGKITPWEAIKIATGKVPGRALNANFEFEDGHWQYGVIVAAGKTLKEIEINAMTGKIGDVETITPAGEAKEVQSELTAALGGKAHAGGGSEDEKGEKE
jgi:uncharacterized membrane protein YkoI